MFQKRHEMNKGTKIGRGANSGLAIFFMGCAGVEVALLVSDSGSFC